MEGYVFPGHITEFIENWRFYEGSAPEDPSDPNVVFEHEGKWWNPLDNSYYITAEISYFDIPLGFSPNYSYAQAIYLRLQTNGTWNGDVYGDVISINIHEHDEVTSISNYSKTTGNSAKVSLGILPSGPTGGTGTVGGDAGKFSFSAGVTKTSKKSITYKAEADVWCGTLLDTYCSKDVFANIPYVTGYWAPAGLVTTHLAFYDEE